METLLQHPLIVVAIAIVIGLFGVKSVIARETGFEFGPLRWWARA